MSLRVMRNALFLFLLTGSALASAASLSVEVRDAGGAPLADAVVYAEPVSGQTLPKAAVKTAQIEQRKRRFNPLVTVVQVGTEISFPNNDTVKHHVYSFSPPKVFDLPLYSGTSAAPQLFDKAGLVVLGCNIHDQMIAYVDVVDTPFFGKTDAAGKLTIEGLPPGKYQLKAWHYNLPITVPFVEQGLTMIGADGTASFKLELKPGATPK
ncbi:MAG: methylamine utilization protein [Burkholderiaceae bacterium]|nr:methylamine utilization protein [Burkholderiaceae bacterium]